MRHGLTLSSTMWRTHSCVPCRDSSRHLFRRMRIQVKRRESLDAARTSASHECVRHVFELALRKRSELRNSLGGTACSQVILSRDRRERSLCARLRVLARRCLGQHLLDFRLILLQQMFARGFEAHYQYRLCVGGAQKSPSFRENYADAINIDGLVRSFE